MQYNKHVYKDCEGVPFMLLITSFKVIKFRLSPLLFSKPVSDLAKWMLKRRREKNVSEEKIRTHKNVLKLRIMRGVDFTSFQLPHDCINGITCLKYEFLYSVLQVYKCYECCSVIIFNEHF